MLTPTEADVLPKHSISDDHINDSLRRDFFSISTRRIA